MSEKPAKLFTRPNLEEEKFQDLKGKRFRFWLKTAREIFPKAGSLLKVKNKDEVFLHGAKGGLTLLTSGDTLLLVSVQNPERWAETMMNTELGEYRPRPPIPEDMLVEYEVLWKEKLFKVWDYLQIHEDKTRFEIIFSGSVEDDE